MAELHHVNLLGTLGPKPECVQRLQEVLNTLASEVKSREPGCLSYQIWEFKTPEKAIAFTLIETWVPDEGFSNHHKQPHLLRADKIISEEKLLAEPEEDRFMKLSGGWMRR